MSRLVKQWRERCRHHCAYRSALHLLLFIAAVGVGLFIRRGVIHEVNLLNPDEAELLAAGRRAALSLLPYKEFTTATYGLWWPLLLGVVARLGVPMTIPVAHIFSAVLASASAYLTFLLLRRVWRIYAAALIALMLGLGWSTGFGSQDFLSLKPDSLGAVLLLSGVVMLTRTSFTANTGLAASVLFGASMWTKYTYLPISILLLVFTGMRLASSLLIGWKRVALTLVSGALAPTGVLVGLALILKVPANLILEPVKIVAAYARGGGLAGGLGIDRISLGMRFQSLIDQYERFGMFMIVWVATLLRWFTWREPELLAKNKWSSHVRILGLAKSLSCVVVGLASVLATYPVAPNYTYVLICATLAATALLGFPTPPQSPRPTKKRVIGVAVLFSILASTSGLGRTSLSVWKPLKTVETRHLLSAEGGRWERAWNESGQGLAASCPPRSRVFVWGWNAELYSFYDWTPASRYVVGSSGLIEASGRGHPPEASGEMRKRLTAELLAKRPDCVVVAIGPSFFPGYEPSVSMEKQIPQLWKVLQQTMSLKGFYWDHVNPFQVLVRKSTSDQS